MNELQLIEQLRAHLPGNPHVAVGCGDDCAVLDLGMADKQVLFKTDAVVAGIHFQPTAEPEQIGHKALARALSDIAAMGGVPSTALVTLGLPENFQASDIKRIYEGMRKLAEQHGVAIAGGETTTNPERLFISVALLGTVAKGKAILRSGAKAGDAIFVSGELGGSIHGRHLDFEPRLAQARWLAEHFTIHAMIDLSDGLASDLRHVLHESRVGAEILAQAVPISRAARLQARSESSAKPPLLAALTDGEDFELLFTLPSNEAVRLLDAWKAEFPGLKLSCIGKVLATPGLKIRDKDGVRELSAKGYVHFGDR